MISTIKSFVLGALLLFGGVSADFKHGMDCEPCAGEEGTCVIKSMVNFFAGATGYFEFEGCEGTNPTLLLKAGRTYKFDQSDETNWMHLLGFAYEADGAHVSVDELEPGVAPGDSDCAANFTCPAPMYFLNGDYTGMYSNIPNLVGVPVTPSEDFGLDAVEPLFFHPLGDWRGYGPVAVYLNYDADYEDDIFYFCHIHPGMTGRIKLLDEDGNKLNEEDSPAIPYEYDVIGEYDVGCGTFNLTDFQLDIVGAACPSFFVCPEETAELSNFANCLESMNCHMMCSMTTNAVGIAELFSYQMIPHHQNAVNMAKAMLKIHADDIVCDFEAADADEEAVTWQCEMLPLFYDMVNTQNHQIFAMQDVLELLGASDFANCDVQFGDIEIARRLDETTSRRTEEAGAFESGIDCTPCEGTEGECEVVLKVDYFAGELGYFTIDGCQGVNPTLHLSINRTYKFNQSDKSNWYHLIGFAYFPDGAHVGVDELEPSIPPGDSNCADSLSCPAPMYFMDGEYRGVYSNNPSLVDIPSPPSEDFGLDAVEPRFFHPIGEWQEYGEFSTYLNFDVAYDQDIFYFCHVHSGMTGRIKLMDENGNMLNAETTPELGYKYDSVSDFDAECGTFALDEFQLPSGMCPERFVCDAGTDTLGTYAGCIDSMNCAMLGGMTTGYGGDGKSDTLTNDAILFMRQMIPHHQNAVNMAKATLKSGEVVCNEGDNEGSAGCILEPILRGIVNSQNHQIQTMQHILSDIFQVDELAKCSAPDDAEPSDDGGVPPGGSGAKHVFSGAMLTAMGAGAVFL